MPSESKMEHSVVIILILLSSMDRVLGNYNTGDLVKINEDKEQHIGIIQKVIKDAAGTVTACEIRMTDGSLETVTKQINDPSMTSYTADSE